MKLPLIVVVFLWLIGNQLWGLAPRFEWSISTPESQAMSSEKLKALSDELQNRGTKAFLVIRNDTIVHEWYAEGHSRTKKHYTASMAKALVGGVSVAIALSDDLVDLDDPVANLIPEWKADPLKSRITLRHLGSHTSGIQDAKIRDETGGAINQNDFPGWEGDFWRWRSIENPPKQDAFTLSRDVAPLLFDPGSDLHYSNPGIAMLSYAVTASLRQTENQDVRSLLKHRVMDPIGVPEEEWSCGYGKTVEVNGLPIVANWGGGNYSANAAARVARLMLKEGNWEGKQLISAEAVRSTVADAGTAMHGGIGWWTNSEGHLGKAPAEAYCGLGAGNQVVLVVPKLNLIMVRNGSSLEPSLGFDAGSSILRQVLFNPLMDAITDQEEIKSAPNLPYPPSRIIETITWARPDLITRKAQGSDNWPITWGDDDALYTAYGDGWGFDPIVEKKLSLGLARITGGSSQSNFRAENLRSETAEKIGQGANGPKASGMLMIDGVLYMWVRNTGNSQLAWSKDHGKSWTWEDWKFETSFGAPTFLNFGKNYEGARDEFVYIYSQDSDSAYDPSDRQVLARVPKGSITDRKAYTFFRNLDYLNEPVWTSDITKRGPVFVHYNNCYRSGITYNSGLQRYLWCQILPQSSHQGGTRFQGGFGVYKSTEPWGPWRTVFFTENWDVGPGETSSFPTKWMSPDGKTLQLVFSGDDFFSIRKAELLMRPPK
ncbi:MAG: serine hydrolase [Verrucomicrobia bacterium]|nr:serine hydrolase [Verrucomicrobiota bacterium]MDA1065033.1 serine hydrolase [Verrucomicrobiota bacterium]